MVRYLTPSQYNAMLRQQQQRQRQAIDAHNREVRSYNQKLKQAIDAHNRDVRNHNQKVNQAINTHNSEVRAYNARVQTNRQRLRNEIERLARQASTPRYVSFRGSVNSVQSAYTRLDRAAEAGTLDERYNEVLDLSEREAANSAGVMNALLGNTAESGTAAANAPESPLTPILQAISGELGDRWKGALFSLNPQNPDAARHFCTSAREVISRILDVKAPDSTVIAAMPDCERTTQQGTPTRRAKIRYFLHVKGLPSADLEDFVEKDMENVIQLFQVFNEGTHGEAGAFSHVQLQSIRKRVEDGIMFLSSLVH